MAVGKHIQLADNLRKDIFSGKYGTEGGLPAASSLSTVYGMALNTVKSALFHLEGEGIIVKRGIGYYVNSISITMTQYAPPSHIRYTNGYTSNLNTIEKVLLPGHLANKLQTLQPANYRVQVSGEVVDGEQQPLQLSHRYYFLPISDENLQRMQADATFDPMWADAPVDLVSHDEITSRAATQEEIGHLNLTKASSVISLWEVIRDKDGNLLLAQEITLSPRIALVFDFPFENKQK